ncbi:MAG: hypothetical protein J6D06_06690 [Clostridia bacterium]|nr:hypothetical protein [Clostridia bacterium]
MKKARFTTKALLSFIIVVMLIGSMSVLSFAADTFTNANLSYGEIVPTDSKLDAQKQSYTFYGDSAELYFMQISKGRTGAHFCIEIFNDKSYQNQIQSYSAPYSITAGNKALKLTWNFKNLGSGAYYGRCYSYVENEDNRTIDSASMKTFVINIDRLSKREVKLVSNVNTANGPRITWEAVPTAKTYNVYRRAAGEKGWTYLYTERNGATSYTDTKATSGKYYAYTVKCYDGKYVSLYNTKGLNSLYLGMPEISVNGNGAAGIATLKWNKVAGATGYYVYRKGGSLSDYNWKLIATIKNGSTISYSDSTAKSTDWQYTYTVKAFNGKYVSAYKYSGVDFDYIPAPTLSRAYSYENGMRIEWKSTNPNVTKYYVYRKDGTSWKYLGAATNKFFIDTTAASNTTYTYTVKAVSDTNAGAYNATGITAKFLKAPVLQKLTFDASYKALVKWEKVNGAAGYKVYRKVADAKSWALISTIKNGATTYYNDASGKASGVKYTYTVRAYDSKNLHSYFDIDGTSAICLAKPVFAVSQVFDENDNSSIEVKWSAINGATKYNVYRRIPGGTWQYLVLNTPETVYADTTAEIGIMYEYAVRALNNNGDISYFYTRTIKPVARPVIESVTVSQDGTKVIWGAIENADSYTVYRKAEIADGWEAIATVTEAEYLDASEEAKTQHFYYTVSATFGETESSVRDGVANFVLAEIFAEFVPATEGSKPAIQVTVNYEDGAMAGIFKSVNEESPVLLEGVKDSFNDTEIEQGAQYTYTLIVTMPGKLENRVSATAKHPLPPLAKALITSCEGNYNEGDPFIVLTWNGVEFADEYIVYRAENGGEWVEVGKVPAEPETPDIPETDEPTTEPSEPDVPETDEPTTEPTEPSVPETEEITEAEEEPLYGTDSETTTTVEEETTTEPDTTEPDEEDPTEPVVPEKTYTFKDENVSSEIEYTYKVVAVATKSEREASESDTASCLVKTLLDKLTGIKFAAEKAEPLKVAVTISWDEVKYAERYEIRRREGDSEPELIAIISAEKELSFTDVVRINREFTYEITAFSEDRGQVKNEADFCWTEVPPVPTDEECLTVVDGMTYIENGLIITDNYMIDDISILLAANDEYSIEVQSSSDFICTGAAIDIYLDGYKLKSYTVIVKGDIDSDGICDAFDYAELEKIVNGHITADDNTTLAADLNNDGIIDAADLELMLEKL